MKRLSILLLIVTATAAHAGGVTSTHLKVDFTNPADAAAKARWSEPEKIGVSANGLGWDGEAASSWDGWIRTKPVAIGMSWRPAVSVSIRVNVSPAPKEIVLDDGSKYVPYFGAVFVRYSPDLKHWSSWMTLQRVQPNARDEWQPPPGSNYRLTFVIPQAEREAYQKRLEKYAQLDVPWKSDEDAAVRWIVAQDPDFFARQLPFAGYVEFLVETGFHGGQRIESFNADVDCPFNGMHQRPKDGNNAAYRGMNEPWKYRAEHPDVP